MSARLTVAIDDGPLERTCADVAVVYWFDSDRPLQAGAGRVDWRLCGQISQLIVDGKLCGESGEAVLLQSGGGLAAPLLIGLGLGARNAFDVKACEALGDPAAAPALAALLKQPGMRGHAVTNIVQASTAPPASGTDTSVRERELSELVLARALFRCGDHEGLGRQILQTYANGLQGHYARHATAVLAERGPR